MIEQAALFEDEPVKFSEILEYIPEGKENAVSMRYLADLLNKDTREIREKVLKARIDGHVIIGDENGYYKPSCEADLIGWIRRSEAALESKNKALLGARRALLEGRYPSYED